jgi:HEAT repeat protein
VVDPNEWNPAERTSDAICASQQRFAIAWREVCGKVLAQQREEQRLRRQATERGFELNVYVPLGLVERKQQQRRGGDVPLEEVYQLTEEVITKEYDNDKFLTEVIEPGRSDRIAIIGEPGAGKTTLQEKIAVWIHDKNKGLPICIPLGGLQGKSLEDYLEQIWLKAALRFIEPDASGVEAQAFASLQKLFREGKVWLLLDGVDEMATTSPVEALATIKEQLTDWLVEARVVLTCRLNVWDANVNNTLTGFETYRTLEFKPEQVEDFIRQWFACAKEPQRGEELLRKLQEPGKERIRELVRNPLRLSLLCQTSYLLPVDEPLPETKAALYERFTRYFYEWKQEQHLDLTQQDELIDELHEALGKLALAGINSATRFRLGRKFARQQMGERLFKLAERLNWLVLVDREANTDEAVYAFFHPTFQEYFAACAIADWRYFLNHDNENLNPHLNPNPSLEYDNGKPAYRIFEPQWKEVILLWLGRQEEELREQKEQFIHALVEFEDECNNFYWYQASFLAALGIAEFRHCSLTDELIALIVEFGFGFFEIELQEWMTFNEPIAQIARTLILETDSQKVIAALVNLSQNCQDISISILAAENLGHIDKGNPIAIEALVDLIEECHSKYTCRRAIKSLGEIGKDNKIAVKTLEELIQNCRDAFTRKEAADSLEKIDGGNPVAVATLVELIQDTGEPISSMSAAYSLGKIGKSNPTAVSALIELIQYSQNESTQRLVAESLGQIDGNSIVVDTLVELIGKSQDEFTLWQAAESLAKIDKDNPLAINTLVQLIQNSQNDWYRGLAAYSLGKFNKGNSFAINTLVQLIQDSESEDIRRKAADSLGQIDKDNPIAVNTLIELIQNSQNELLLSDAAESLGKIGKSNPKAITTLVELIQNTQNEFICLAAVESLGQISQSDTKVVFILVELIQNTQNESICWQAADSLTSIVVEFQMVQVITALKGYLLDETYKNDFERYRNCYKVIWHCAQNMSYPDFYQAWQ